MRFKPSENVRGLSAKLAGEILKHKLMQKAATQLTLSLVADSDILLAGEIIAGSAAAVAALPELVVLGGSMVFVAAVSVVGSKVGSILFGYLAELASSGIYHLFQKRYHRWF